MEHNRLYFMIALFLVGVGLIRLLRDWRPVHRGPLALHAGLLVLTVAAYLAWPGYGGLLALLAWALLVWLPQIVQQAIVRLVHRQRWPAAQRLAGLLAWLPQDPITRAQPILIRALQLASDGQMAAAEALLQELTQGDSDLAHLARLHHLRLRDDWPAVRRLCEFRGASHDQGPEARQYFPLYLRALFEIGDYDAAVLAYSQYAATQEGLPDQATRQAWLLCFAFGGRLDDLDLLLRRLPGATPRDMAALWRATAAWAGQHPATPMMLNDCLQSPNAQVRQVAARRLAQPPPLLPASLPPLLDQISHELRQEARFELERRPRFSVSPLTLTLVSLNCAVYGAEVALGGSTNLPTLARLGALVTPLASTGDQWWRLLTATFLHYGLFHLLMNMGALLLFGPFVERALGSRRFLGTYLLAGVGSMLTVHLFSLLGEPSPGILVGASGAIMGLVGATGAILWRAWQAEHLPFLRRRLQMIGGILGLQVIFDLVTPEVSGTAHLSGAILGLLAGLCLRFRL